MNIKGSVVALVTPMKNDASIDFNAYAELLDWHKQQGTDGVVVLGTTGESPTVSDAEREQLIEIAVNKGGADFPVIVGTGSNSTSHTIELTKNAKALGATACLIVVPYYNKPTQEGLYQHFKAIVDAVDIPVILYNVPGRTVTNLEVDTVARLAELKNIVGIKDATNDPERVSQLRKACDNDFILLSGEDATALDFILSGGDGVVSVAANVVPKQFHLMCTAALNNEVATAKQINTELAELNKALFIESNPIPVKWALVAMKRIPAGIRLPLTTLSADKQQQLKKVLTTIGVVSE